MNSPLVLMLLTVYSAAGRIVISRLSVVIKLMSNHRAARGPRNAIPGIGEWHRLWNRSVIELERSILVAFTFNLFPGR